jgi:hypothetical protein
VINAPVHNIAITGVHLGIRPSLNFPWKMMGKLTMECCNLFFHHKIRNNYDGNIGFFSLT